MSDDDLLNQLMEPAEKEPQYGTGIKVKKMMTCTTLHVYPNGNTYIKDSKSWFVDGPPPKKKNKPTIKQGITAEKEKAEEY